MYPYVFYTHANEAQLKSVIYGICTYTWYITVLRFYEKYSISIKQATWKKERMGKYIYVSLNDMEKGDKRDENNDILWICSNHYLALVHAWTASHISTLFSNEIAVSLDGRFLSSKKGWMFDDTFM